MTRWISLATVDLAGFEEREVATLSGGERRRLAAAMVLVQDPQVFLLDPSVTEAEFPGWRASTPLAEGVARTIEWYAEHGVEETYTHLRISD